MLCEGKPASGVSAKYIPQPGSSRPLFEDPSAGGCLSRGKVEGGCALRYATQPCAGNKAGAGSRPTYLCSSANARSIEAFFSAETLALAARYW